MRKLILTALLASSSIPAEAQQVPITDETNEASSEADAAIAAEMKELQKLFSGLFGSTDPTPIDPVRLTLAKKTTAQIMPDGIYSKIMDDMMTKVFGVMLAQPGGMSDLEISLTTGVEASEAGLDEAKRKAITDLLDPNHAKRASMMQASLKPMMDKMARTVEPPMREGLARAYARKFSAAQLTELNGFLATPTGSFYASESFLLQADPEVMQAVFSVMPAMMGDMMNPAADIEKDMADIPPAKTLNDLSAKEKDSLAQLLGTSADKLSAFGAVETSIEPHDATADAITEEADPFANESGEEPWWDRSNWEKEDQKKMTDLESKMLKASEQSEAASTASLDFETAVMLRVRKRFLANGWTPEASSE